MQTPAPFPATPIAFNMAVAISIGMLAGTTTSRTASFCLTAVYHRVNSVIRRHGLRGRSGRFEARIGPLAADYGPGAITTAIGSQNQSGVAQWSVKQSSAPLASQELVLELVLVLVLVQATSCNLTRAWPTSIAMTPLTVCWCGSSRAGIVAVKDTVDNRITVVSPFARN
jgi:hypothetical protein